MRYNWNRKFENDFGYFKGLVLTSNQEVECHAQYFNKTYDCLEINLLYQTCGDRSELLEAKEMAVRILH